MRSWRPPNTGVLIEVPVSTDGGAAGSIHIDCFVLQVPSNCLARRWCGSPGVDAFCQAAIIACCSALIGGGADLGSSANASGDSAPANTTSASENCAFHSGRRGCMDRD